MTSDAIAAGRGKEQKRAQQVFRHHGSFDRARSDHEGFREVESRVVLYAFAFHQAGRAAIECAGGDVYDLAVAVPLIKRCQKAFPDLRECSFDRGFHSPSNREELDKLLELTVLPKKGKLSTAERKREAEPAFAAARRKHSGVESAINSLEHRGLDRVGLRGADGFEPAVGLSVLASNLHRVGQLLRERKRMRRECKQWLQSIRRQRAA